MAKATPSAKQTKYPVERRECTRYELRGAAQFRWKTEDGLWTEASGTTANMGRAGAFIESEAVPKVGSAVQIVVSLHVDSGTEVEVQLAGTGNVRHSRDSSNERGGFGAWVVFRTEALAIEALKTVQTDTAGPDEVSHGSEAKTPQST